MITMIDTRINYEFEKPTLSEQRLTKYSKNHLDNFRYYRRTSVPNRLLSTGKFPSIESYQLIISDTNKDVLRNEPERSEIVQRKNQANLKVISRIKELAEYQEGWYDGIEGIPADSQTIKDAIAFAKNLDFNHIHIPYISLATDGEVSFWWDLETIKLGLGFYGDGTYSYYAKLLENGKEFFGDDIDSVNSTLPPEILEKLKK